MGGGGSKKCSSSSPAPAAAPAAAAPQPAFLGVLPPSAKQWRKINVVLGPPGCGKGTQAPRMAREWNLPHLSTGHILREHVQKNTDLGKKVKSFMDRGELVPDDVMIAILRDRTNQMDCGWGFILDGFPRTVAQARAFDQILRERNETVSRVIILNVSDDILIDRMTGRWIHKPSGRAYHAKYNKPKSLISSGGEARADNMKDDITGEALVQRSDDNESTVKNRLAIYHRESDGLADHYKPLGLNIYVDAKQDPEKVWTDIKKMNGPQWRKIVALSGPPGSGKGSQAIRISKEWNIPHISTGNILRDAVHKGTETGKRVKAYMDKGDLVPDDVMLGLIRDRINQIDCGWGFVLDGFPRTAEQARLMSMILKEKRVERIVKFINFMCPDDVCVERMTGRWVHKASGRAYHVKYNKPKSLGDGKPSADNMKDDITGDPLYQRSDDTEAVVKTRLAQFHKDNQPVLDYYKLRGTLVNVDAKQNADSLFQEIRRIQF